MAAARRSADPSLAEVLFEEPYRIEFFQAVRLLERMREEQGGAPSSEPAVRFRSLVTLAFPPSAIAAIEPSMDKGGSATLTSAFMGLAGPSGVLPRHYTELSLERARRKDFALRAFFDIFNDRVMALFQRAWEKYRFTIGYERNALRQVQPDQFSQHVYDLIGMGAAGLRDRLEFDEAALLFYAGLLGQRPHSAVAIAALLSDYFGVSIGVAQFAGQWLEITPENQTRLGDNPNSQLGVRAIAGAMVWDQQARFVVQVGPLSLTDFRRFLKTGPHFRALVGLARFCAGQEFDFDVQLVLRAAEVPASRLGEAALGYTSWLKVEEFEHDDDQVVFTGIDTRAGCFPG